MALEDLAAKGREKLERKAELMRRHWEEAREKMITHYREVGFGPTVTAHYEEGIRAAVYRTDPEKWYRRWLERMKE
ncbi:MAG: hypothetical protein DRG27_00995 [Deltaproteobacteria bacterium]|nr:MAG: hypothetical protein DRG27_00995 [Deltaproteobacteria bacterium]